MQLETLRMFCDLADLRSLSKTAKKHFVTQSAISQQLAQLETAHKCQLVSRKKRPDILGWQQNKRWQHLQHRDAHPA